MPVVWIPAVKGGIFMPQSDSATLDLFENYQDYLAL